MKKLFYCPILVLAFTNIYASDKDIVALTKEKSDNSIFKNTQKLALIQSLMNEQKFYPIQIGSKSISVEEFSTLTREQRNLVNKVSHPGFCGRLCGHDYSIADEDDIKRLEKEMPKNFMHGHRILKIKRPQLFGSNKPCCADYCGDLFCCCALPAAAPIATGAITLTCGAQGPCSVATPYLIAGLVQMIGSITCEAAILSAAAIRYFCCYDTKEYTFGENTNTDEEETDLSSSSEWGVALRK